MAVSPFRRNREPALSTPPTRWLQRPLISWTVSFGVVSGCLSDSPAGDVSAGTGAPTEDAGEADGSADGSADGTSVDESSSDGAAAGCGNGVIEGVEICDTDALGGETCAGLGYQRGELSCTDNCLGFELAGCGFYECGNGEQEGDEDCDGTVGAATCVDAGFDNGTLFCTADCAFDTAMCGICGDRSIDPEEACEPELGLDSDCAARGFDAGELTCGEDCQLDTSGCQLCGNDAIEGTESCDGDNLGGATCLSLGLEGGDLACGDDCGFDVAQCDIMGIPFASDRFYQGLSLTAGIPSCDDITATGTPLGLSDDSNTTVGIGFVFDFYGVPFTQATIQSNGAMNLGATGFIDYFNTCLPLAGLGSDNAILAFWDDLNPSIGGAVRYQTVGAAGAQRFVVQWNAPVYASLDSTQLIDVRVVLHEGSNVVDVCYADTQGAVGDTSNTGQSATSGIQMESGTGMQFSCNAPHLVDGLQLTYLPL